MSLAKISVSDVRTAIYRAAASGPSDGFRPSSLLGVLFHECASALSAPDSPTSWTQVLDASRLRRPDAASLLANHCYTALLAPRIERHRLALSNMGGEVLQLWQALNNYTAWLVGVLRAAHSRNRIQFDEAKGVWQNLDQVLRVDQALQFRHSTSSREIMIYGEADALWFDSESGRWCLVELKLGTGSPEADLAQLCLYHLLLSQSLPSSTNAGLCLIRFQPEIHQLLIEPSEIESAQRDLLRLVESLAPSSPAPNPQSNSHLAEGERLITAFRTLGLDLRLADPPIVGATFVRYILMPKPGVRLSKVISNVEDVQIQLGLEHMPSIRKERGRIVADLARPDRQTLQLGDIAQSWGPQPERGLLLLAGVSLTGESHFLDLADSNNPHLLVGGTSGSGKSEWLRLAIASLILRATPDRVRLVLIDPKRTAFADLRHSTYLWDSNSFIYPDENPVESVLDPLIEEMERRYRLFSETGAKDLDDFIALRPQPVPRIVLFCDEYADLVVDKRRKEIVLTRIQRLGQKARAAGIHLVLATQSPRREVVDGILKANLPGRICLRVNSLLESRIVLDAPGGEKLLGRGDLLLSSVGELVRLQAPIVEPATWRRVCQPVKTMRA